MSSANVENQRRWFAGFNARDVEAVIAVCDPSGVFISTFAVGGGAVYQGHGGMRRDFGDLAEAWGDDIRLEPEAYSTSVSTRSRSASRAGAEDTAARKWRCRSRRCHGGAMVACST
jgi:hypothetical protein